MLRMINKTIAPLTRRLRLMITRGVVKLIDDAQLIQELQVTALADEVLDGVEHIQQYGFTSHPHPEADCLILNVGANRAHPIVIAVEDRRYRLTSLAEGEVALYDDLGQRIVLYRDRIEVEAPKVVVLSDNVQLGADGGPAVARVGDMVNVGSGSSAGQWPIVSGSAKVAAA